MNEFLSLPSDISPFFHLLNDSTTCNRTLRPIPLFFLWSDCRGQSNQNGLFFFRCVDRSADRSTRLSPFHEKGQSDQSKKKQKTRPPPKAFLSFLPLAGVNQVKRNGCKKRRKVNVRMRQAEERGTRSLPSDGQCNSCSVRPFAQKELEEGGTVCLVVVAAAALVTAITAAVSVSVAVPAAVSPVGKTASITATEAAVGHGAGAVPSVAADDGATVPVATDAGASDSSAAIGAAVARASVSGAAVSVALKTSLCVRVSRFHVHFGCFLRNSLSGGGGQRCLKGVGPLVGRGAQASAAVEASSVTSVEATAIAAVPSVAADDAATIPVATDAGASDSSAATGTAVSRATVSGTSVPVTLEASGLVLLSLNGDGAVVVGLPLCLRRLLIVLFLLETASSSEAAASDPIASDTSTATRPAVARTAVARASVPVALQLAGLLACELSVLILRSLRGGDGLRGGLLAQASAPTTKTSVAASPSTEAPKPSVASEATVVAAVTTTDDAATVSVTSDTSATDTSATMRTTISGTTVTRASVPVALQLAGLLALLGGVLLNCLLSRGRGRGRGLSGVQTTSVPRASSSRAAETVSTGTAKCTSTNTSAAIGRGAVHRADVGGASVGGLVDSRVASLAAAVCIATETSTTHGRASRTSDSVSSEGVATDASRASHPPRSSPELPLRGCFKFCLGLCHRNLTRD
mmetsp:Transcript_26302/g.51669  ORF Transcript_26302/g.51669 Transcript_26302/m.51669 type:complete len:694 (+) Transcript_26302:781-2862(+)